MSLSSVARRFFSWSFRNRLRGIQDRIRNIRIRWVSGKPLSPAVQGQINEYLYLRPTLASMQERSTWCIDEFNVHASAVEIRGWALTPFDEYAPVTFTLNGDPFENVRYPSERADVANVFWYRFGAGLCAFVCRTPVSEDQTTEMLFPDGFAEIQFCDARTLAPFRSDHGIYVADPTKDDFPDPGSERRNRVHGNAELASFQVEGSSAFVKLELALNKICGKGFEDFPRVLDWGCGCGRLTRYFRDLTRCSVVGIDIDENNVQWCAETFDFATFETCEVDPPTSFPGGSFDLVFGISVMTHLNEKDRAAWLSELDRICDDGAIILLSTQGNAALCRTAIRTDTLIALRQRGALDVDVSLAAEDLSSEPRRYIDCFLMDEYIRHRWSEYFEVLDVIPGYIGNVQDLVVLRKKSN
ncbi:MAG: hypothetical protein CL908_21725 [Deltaproteobacteria bacterium]|nr:hypothetical protein [Deltaproteobacteria bacterium]